MKKDTDFLVIGSGISGLFFALKASKFGKVCIITKDEINNNTTVKAQGGIASVTYHPDSYEKHITDTIKSGAGISNPEIVEMVIKEGPDRINDLLEIGTSFDKNSLGNFDLSKEGGHSEERVLHFKDKTGEEIQRALFYEVKNNPNISILENHFAIEIITQHHTGQLVKRSTPNICCYGAYVYDIKNRKVITFLAKKTLMASGGGGNVYSFTTNPTVCTGDGVAMVYRAKGLVENMEFVQFHPTALYDQYSKPAFLITEALRGEGAILKNHKGEDFCRKYDERGSLAPRDIVARSIDNELKISGKEFVYLDTTQISKNILLEKFPTIFAKCLEKGINISKDYIPVIPAAHYMCGGITVDEHGLSSIKNLYAVGEVASTGMHGANRLASNSLLEAIVYAHRAAVHSGTNLQSANSDIMSRIPDWNDEGTLENEELILVTYSIKEVQQIMSSYVGIVRSNIRLQRALDRLEILYKETENLYKRSNITLSICELRNLINTSYLIVKMASERKSNIGLHYNIDFLS